jgi:hypothetical protein
VLKNGSVIHPGLHWLVNLVAVGIDSDTGIDDLDSINRAKNELKESLLNVKEIMRLERNETKGDGYENSYKDVRT